MTLLSRNSISQFAASNIVDMFPKCINSYFECAIGNGQVLTEFIKRTMGRRVEIIASDPNDAVVALYKNVQANPLQLIAICEEIHSDFLACPTDPEIMIESPSTVDEAITSRKAHYIWCRDAYNELEDKTCLEASALFLYCRKKCARIIIRPNGNIASACGKTTSDRKFVDANEILMLSSLIRNVEFVYYKDIGKIPKKDDRFSYIGGNSSEEVDVGGTRLTMRKM